VLAVLIERDGKQIPISPDCVGMRMTLNAYQRIKLLGPDPLMIEVENTLPHSEGETASE
jgi:pyrimidine operon attenuation protein/uracil phosphoribosyltransferase